MRVQADKVGSEDDSDVLQGDRAENAPETRIESAPKPWQRKKREEYVQKIPVQKNTMAPLGSVATAE